MITLLARAFYQELQGFHEPSGAYPLRRALQYCRHRFQCVALCSQIRHGVLSGSVAVMADAFNNLADAASAVLLLLGFRFAGIKPAPDRPFGHGRIEYIVGLIVAGLILVTSVQMGSEARMRYGIRCPLLSAGRLFLYWGDRSLSSSIWRCLPAGRPIK